MLNDRRTAFRRHRQRVINLTTSCGLTPVKDRDDSHNPPLQRADKAMYKSKKYGRNQISTLSSLEDFSLNLDKART